MFLWANVIRYLFECIWVKNKRNKKINGNNSNTEKMQKVESKKKSFFFFKKIQNQANERTHARIGSNSAKIHNDLCDIYINTYEYEANEEKT